MPVETRNSSKLYKMADNRKSKKGVSREAAVEKHHEEESKDQIGLNDSSADSADESDKVDIVNSGTGGLSEWLDAANLEDSSLGGLRDILLADPALCRNFLKALLEPSHQADTQHFPVSQSRAKFYSETERFSDFGKWYDEEQRGGRGSRY